LNIMQNSLALKLVPYINIGLSGLDQVLQNL
jgi:hypothetical protein